MRNRRKGFTLAELLVVVAIIAILIAISIPIFVGKTESAKEAACAANRRSLKGEIVNAYLWGDYDALDKAFNVFYTKEKYPCPSGGTYSWKDGKVVCSIHNTEGDTPDEPEQSGDGTVILKDSQGNTYTINPNISWEDLQNKVSSPDNQYYCPIYGGTIIGDSTGTYLLNTHGELNLKDQYSTIKGMTASDLAAKYPGSFVKLDSSVTVVTEADKVDGKWPHEMPAGTVCYYGGSYYVAPSTAGIWTFPPSGWKQIPQ